MAEFFAMHGYAAYVWTAYAIFFVVLLGDTIAPLLRRRRILADLRGRLKREHARGTNKSQGTP
jgi:heme exporter protein D